MKIATSVSILSGVLLALALAIVCNASGELKSMYFTTSDGVKIHYLEKGEGETLLFVPGFLGPAEIWDYQIEHFSKRYRVIAMDPRSQGESGKPADGHFQSRRGKDIGELAAYVSKEPVVVAGWSLAVLETLTYVKEHGAGRFKAIVIVDMYTGVDVAIPEPHPYRAGWIGWIEGMQTDRAGWTDKWLRSFYKGRKPDSYFESLAKGVSKTPTNSAVTLLSNLMLTDDRDLRPVVDELKCPVLMVMSSNGWAAAEAEMAKKRWPEMAVRVIPDTGHALFADKPEEFNKILDEFLSGVF